MGLIPLTHSTKYAYNAKVATTYYNTQLHIQSSVYAWSKKGHKKVSKQGELKHAAHAMLPGNTHMVYK